jgi:hypothetical protein
VVSMNGVFVSIGGIKKPLALSSVDETTANLLCNTINLTAKIDPSAILKSLLDYDQVDSYWDGDYVTFNNETNAIQLAPNCGDVQYSVNLTCKTGIKKFYTK